MVMSVTLLSSTTEIFYFGRYYVTSFYSKAPGITSRIIEGEVSCCLFALPQAFATDDLAQSS